MTPFDYIGIINMKGVIPETLEGYDSFVANRNFSNTIDSILNANEINVDCDKQMNFDYYYYGLPKKKRFGKWYKKAKAKNTISDAINRIVEYYNCSKDKAQDIYDILENNGLLDKFAEMTDKGGRAK